MDLYEAVAASRVHHQLMPNVIAVEEDFDGRIIDDLRKRGHEVYQLPPNTRVSAVQAVQRISSEIVHAASDPRKYGLAAAY